MKFHDNLLKLSLITILVGVLSVAWIASASAQEINDNQLQQGAQIYAENCAICHGENGEGRIGATLAKNWPSIRPELATRATITNGVPGTAMPAWSQENGGPLSATEIDAVVTFILSWQTGGAPKYTPAVTATRRPEISPIPNIEGDPNQGALLYDHNCAVCHGLNGEGRIGATLSKSWGSIRPDLAIRSTIVEGVSGTAMPAWSQENGGPLSEEDIDDIVSFIMSFAAPSTSVTTTPETQATSRWVGWGGLLLTIVLFVIIVVAAMVLQKKNQKT